MTPNYDSSADFTEAERPKTGGFTDPDSDELMPQDPSNESSESSDIGEPSEKEDSECSGKKRERKEAAEPIEPEEEARKGSHAAAKSRDRNDSSTSSEGEQRRRPPSSRSRSQCRKDFKRIPPPLVGTGIKSQGKGQETAKRRREKTPAPADLPSRS